MDMANKLVLLWALALTAFLLMGLTVPHAFTPGTRISSAEMNANFNAVKAAVDALEAERAATTASLAALTAESGLSWRQLQYARNHGLDATYVEPRTGMRFVLIPPGEFVMGSPASEPGHQNAEDQYHVRLTQAYYLSVHEVTNAQYRLFDAGHTSTIDGDQRPVTDVSVAEAVAFAAWVSEGKSETYALPTEAQWEYACRGGTTTPFSFGPNISAAQANYNGASPYDGAPAGYSRGTTTDVGSFPANDWGLHDMHGNVWEYCSDWWSPYVGDLGSVTEDPTGPASSTGSHPIRGGAYNSPATNCRAAMRTDNFMTVSSAVYGFRLARPVAP